MKTIVINPDNIVKTYIQLAKLERKLLEDDIECDMMSHFVLFKTKKIMKLLSKYIPRTAYDEYCRGRLES